MACEGVIASEGLFQDFEVTLDAADQKGLLQTFEVASYHAVRR